MADDDLGRASPERRQYHHQEDRPRPHLSILKLDRDSAQPPSLPRADRTQPLRTAAEKPSNGGIDGNRAHVREAAPRPRHARRLRRPGRVPRRRDEPTPALARPEEPAGEAVLALARRHFPDDVRMLLAVNFSAAVASDAYARNAPAFDELLAEMTTTMIRCGLDLGRTYVLFGGGIPDGGYRSGALLVKSSWSEASFAECADAGDVTVIARDETLFSLRSESVGAVHAFWAAAAPCSSRRTRRRRERRHEDRPPRCSRTRPCAWGSGSSIARAPPGWSTPAIRRRWPRKARSRGGSRSQSGRAPSSTSATDWPRRSWRPRLPPSPPSGSLTPRPTRTSSPVGRSSLVNGTDLDVVVTLSDEDVNRLVTTVLAIAREELSP